MIYNEVVKAAAVNEAAWVDASAAVDGDIVGSIKLYWKRLRRMRAPHRKLHRN